MTRYTLKLIIEHDGFISEAVYLISEAQKTEFMGVSSEYWDEMIATACKTKDINIQSIKDIYMELKPVEASLCE